MRRGVQFTTLVVPRMRAGGRHGWRRDLLAAAVLASLAGLPRLAVADDATERTVAQVQPLDRVQLEQERLRRLMEGKPKAYEDRYMTPADAASAAGAGSEESPTSESFRSIAVESKLGWTRLVSDGLPLKVATEIGWRIEGKHETLNYGEFIAQADLRHRQGDAGASVALAGYSTRPDSERVLLRNVGLPLTGNVFADTALGDMYSELTDALARSYRTSLGSSTVRGLSARVFGREFDVRAGVGERGTLAGAPYPGFDRSSGTLSWLGGSMRVSGQWVVGAQIARATQLPVLSDTLAAVPSTARLSSVDSAAAAVVYGRDAMAAGDWRMRLSLVGSRAVDAESGVARHATGGYAEGAWQMQRSRHEFGFHRVDRGLRFADVLLPPEGVGGYWRWDYQAQAVYGGLGVDYDRVEAGPAAVGVAATPRTSRVSLDANVQYRLNRDSAIGGNAHVTQTRVGGSADNATGADSTTRGVNASAFVRLPVADWGRSRVALTVHRNELIVANAIAATGEELRWEHDWVTGRYDSLRPELTTVLGYARDRSGGETQRYPTAGTTFRWWRDAGWTVFGNLRYSSRSGNLYATRGVSGALAAEQVWAGGWRGGLSVTMNQAIAQATGSNVGAVFASRSDDKTALLYVRWEAVSGQPAQAIGLRSGASGTGSIIGYVFFDSNRDGERQVDEAGVAGVEVLLDGRYRAITDRDGRFEFVQVATGPHHVTLRQESIPLPWGAALGQRPATDVPLRGTVELRLPVVRTGD